MDQYREWIKAEADKVPKAPQKRYQTGQELVVRANGCCKSHRERDQVAGDAGLPGGISDREQVHGRGRAPASGGNARQAARGCEAGMEALPVGLPA